jgi:ABC transporter related
LKKVLPNGNIYVLKKEKQIKRSKKMKKRIATITIALIMLFGIQTFASTSILTPSTQTGVGTGNTTQNPTGSATLSPTPTATGNNASTTGGTNNTTNTDTTTSTPTPTASKSDTPLPKAGTSDVVLYGVSVLAVVAIVLYRKITK